MGAQHNLDPGPAAGGGGASAVYIGSSPLVVAGAGGGAGASGVLNEPGSDAGPGEAVLAVATEVQEPKRVGAPAAGCPDDIAPAPTKGTQLAGGNGGQMDGRDPGESWRRRRRRTLGRGRRPWAGAVADRAIRPPT